MMVDKQDLFQDRMSRTVEVSVDPGVAPVDRYTFGEHIESTVRLKQLEAIGPTANRNVFQLTFFTVEAAREFADSGDFTIKGGQQAKVAPLTKAKIRMRVHKVPHYVTMSKVVDALEHNGKLKVQHAHMERSRVKGFEHVFTLVRVFIVTADSMYDVPDFINRHYQEVYGKALVTVADRPPVCLRCHEEGHVRRECEAPFCSSLQKVHAQH